MLRLKIKNREKNDNLPIGVNRGMSPLFNYHEAPCVLTDYVLRYSHLLNAVERLTNFASVGNQSLKILDVGCGYGEMLRFFQSSFKAKGTRIQYRGYDLDPFKFGLIEKEIFKSLEGTYFKFIKADFTTFTEYEKADVAICSEVLEHLEKEDGLFLLKQLRKKVKYLVGTVPAPCKRENEWHVNEMDRKTLEAFLKLAGFTRIYTGSLEIRFDRKLAGEWVSKSVWKNCTGLIKGNEAIEGSDTFFVYK